MDILVPTSAARRTAVSSATSHQLKGKRIGIVSNGWTSMEAIIGRMSQSLRENFDAAEVKLYSVHINKPILAETLNMIAGECDAAIVGIAN